MKYLFLCVLFMVSQVSVKAEDELLKGSEEVLDCKKVEVKEVSEMKPQLPDATELAVPVMPVLEDKPEARELTSTEKMKAFRTKLEEKNLVLLEKKLELIRLQQEMALLRNLERSMDQTLTALDKLN